MDDEDFQRAANVQGAEFETLANSFLESIGFELRGPKVIHEIGCEIDQVVLAPNGQEVYFEHKGSWRGKRPGMRRTDTVKKGLLTGFLLKSVGIEIPFCIMTSHMPDSGRALRMIDVALKDGALSSITIANTDKAAKDLLTLFGE